MEDVPAPSTSDMTNSVDAIRPGSEYLGTSAATYKFHTGISYKGVISNHLSVVSIDVETGECVARVTEREVVKQVEDYPSFEAIPHSHPLKQWASTLGTSIMESIGSYDRETQLLSLTDQTASEPQHLSFLKQREYVLHADRLIGCDHYLDRRRMGVKARAVNLQCIR